MPGRCRPFALKVDAVPGRLNQLWFKARGAGRLLRPVLRTLRRPTTPTCRSSCGSCRRISMTSGCGARPTSLSEARAYLDQVQPPTRRAGRCGAVGSGSHSDVRRRKDAAARPRSWPRSRSCARRARRSPRSEVVQPLALAVLDQPQGHRHALSRVRAVRGHRRDDLLRHHARRAGRAGPAAVQRNGVRRLLRRPSTTTTSSPRCTA